MIKKHIYLILFGSFLQAQESAVTAINTDRPDQTETAFLVPKGRFQMENGFSYTKHTSKSYNINFIENLWKYGFSEKIEFRMITELTKEKDETQEVSGFRPIAFGTKIKLTEENGIFPKISLIAHAHLVKSASKAFRNEKWAPEFRLTFLHNLHHNQTFSYNLGTEWDTNDLFPVYIYTVSYGYSITGRLGVYAEVFGNLTKKEPAQHLFDGGFTYLISSDFMVDCSAGLGLNSAAPKYYWATGFSFRL
ncbi:hypothetical protein DI487_06190 [Flavobacterium sediminis]|uniref:Transporter n=1 Tax=Flavobacterium sediminis TaxID=2201181 RepID=A0A2U8QTM1_9FLAO|nr:transporter [Flavobacterium sediminis]AWM13488.1 hypothetical protein DI487_06190 [Flavobacterium sediminis]